MKILKRENNILLLWISFRIKDAFIERTCLIPHQYLVKFKFRISKRLEILNLNLDQVHSFLHTHTHAKI